jgi:hypothetical protein
MALQVGTKNEKDKWASDLQAATSLESCEAPNKDGTAKKKKQTVGMGMQKGLASATADSSVGKAVCIFHSNLNGSHAFDVLN